MTEGSEPPETNMGIILRTFHDIVDKITPHQVLSHLLRNRNESLRTGSLPGGSATDKADDYDLRPGGGDDMKRTKRSES